MSTTESSNKKSVNNEKVDVKQFMIGGKCLAFHGPLLYEAKILRIWDPIDRKLILDNNNNNNNNNNYNGSSGSSSDSGVGNSNNSNKRHDQSDLCPPENVQDQNNFFIHYQGWKSTWDEWIGIDRIREYNDENIELKKQLIQEAKDSQKPKNQHDNSSGNKKRKNGGDSNLNNKNSESSGTSSNKRRNVESGSGTSSSSSSNGKKNSSSSNNGFNSRSNSNGNNKHDKIGYSSSNQENNSSRRSQSNAANNTSSSSSSNRDDASQWNRGPSKVVLHIPIKLKAKLVDDWELITKDKRILTLPSKMTINQMLSTYKKQTLKNMTLVEQCQLNEFLSGLVDYFESSLSRLLLYRLERLQYETLLKKYKDKNQKMIRSDIYGPLHLLRLITILPELISATTMDMQSCHLIIKQCERLLIWMTIHIDSVFPTLNPREDVNLLMNNEEGYDNTSSQYEGLASGL